MQPLSDPSDSVITFGAPGSNRSLATLLSDELSEAGRPYQDEGNSVLDAQGDPYGPASGLPAFMRGVEAAERQTRLVDTINARDNALADAADIRIRTVQQQTGVQLENPFRGGYLAEARDRIGGQLDAAGGLDESDLLQKQRDIFNERVDEVAQNFPDKAAALSFYQSLDDQARAIARSAEEGNTGEGGLVAQLAGSLYGSRRDPLLIGSLFLGPGGSLAETAIGRIAAVAFKQGLFNAGLSALAQPWVQSWRQEIGARSGVLPAIENVGLAAVIGAIPGGAIQGIKELSPTARQSISRLAAGSAKPGDIATAADGLGVKLDADTAATVRMAETDMGHTALAAGDRPASLPESHLEAIERQAVRHAQDPANEPPPALASPTEAPADVRGADKVMQAFEARPLDGAEALRSSADLVEGALRSADPDVATAGRLAMLSDDAWSQVRDGRASAEHAAIVAELSPDPIYDATALARVTEARPQTPTEARLIAAEAIESENRRMLPAEPHSLSQPASWVIREKATGKVIIETFDRAKVDALNTAKYEAVPILDYLGSLNREIRENAKSTVAMPDGTRRDVMDLVPLQREDGSVVLATQDAALAFADEQGGIANLVRACNL